MPVPACVPDHHLGNTIDITIKISIPENANLREISINDKIYKHRTPSSKFLNIANNNEELDVRINQGTYIVKFTQVLLENNLNFTAIYFGPNGRKKIEKQIIVQPEIEKKRKKLALLNLLYRPLNQKCLMRISLLRMLQILEEDVMTPTILFTLI